MQTGIEQLLDLAKTQAASHQYNEAAHTCRLALAQEPNDPECLLRLACVLLCLKRYEEAFHFVRHFLRLVKDLAYGYFLAGYLAREIGRWEESRSYLQRAIELNPSDLHARMLCCMSSFTIIMDERESRSILQAYATGLDEIIRITDLESSERIDNAVNALDSITPFFLPYLGYDVRDLQQKYGSWACSIMAAKYPQFSHQIQKHPGSDKIKLGIVSNYFHSHSHWKIAIKGWLEQLDRSRFSIHCFHTGDICDDITTYASSLADSFMQCNDIGRIAAAIYEQELDALIHSGIGMDTNTIKLAALRLCPVQCTSWGHPLTTGMRTIDYFISSDLMEPDNGADHYTEKLVRLPNLSIYCKPVAPIASSPDRFELPGTSRNDVLFLCCQNLFKYLPQYDHVFPDIARDAPCAKFIFIENHIAELTERFKARISLAFEKQGLPVSNHVLFVPPLNAHDYAALNSRADIYLDCMEWSGGNTTLESLPYDKPIVTLPGRFMRGRHTYAILRMMGIHETIATSVDDYIAIAVRLANDTCWRGYVSDRISCNKFKIYQDRECITAMEDFLVQAVRSNCYGANHAIKRIR